LGIVIIIIIIIIIIKRILGSSTSIVSRLWAGRPGSNSGKVQGCSSFRRRVQTGSVAHPASYPIGTGALSPEVKRPAREADHSPQSSTEVKNA
jgi:hypothetical protein